jgi:hypothetical protein
LFVAIGQPLGYAETVHEASIEVVMGVIREEKQVELR